MTTDSTGNTGNTGDAVARYQYLLRQGRPRIDVGIVRTDVAQRLSLLISLLAAFLWFGESLNAEKGAGLALGLSALLCMVWRVEPRGVDAGPRAGRRGSAGLAGRRIWHGNFLVAKSQNLTKIVP